MPPPPSGRFRKCRLWAAFESSAEKDEDDDDDDDDAQPPSLFSPCPPAKDILVDVVVVVCVRGSLLAHAAPPRISR